MKNNRKILSRFFFAVSLITFFFANSQTMAQSRDYFTDSEIELVRDANEIDRRIEVLTRAIDRRFIVIEKDSTQTKQLEKESDKWGELPAGSRAELLNDISRILQKAIDDLEDLYASKESNSKISKAEVKDDLDKLTRQILEKNDQRFPQAVHDLADAARRYLPKLEAISSGSIDQRERGAIDRSVESCRAIIEASASVPKPTAKRKKT